MVTCRVIFRSVMPAAQSALAAWHEQQGAFERLSPPWQPLKVLSRHGEGSRKGVQIEIRLPLFAGIDRRALFEHTIYEPGELFCDEQRFGPFRSWRHVHRFEQKDVDQSILSDEIEFSLPGGNLGNWLAKKSVIKALKRVFAYRHFVTAQDLHRQKTLPSTMPRSVLISGASGFIGGSLTSLLQVMGITVYRLIRRSSPATAQSFIWEPEKDALTLPTDLKLDAVVHLAGEPIAAARFNAAVKQRIEESRTAGTRLLVRALSALVTPPPIFLSASAIGIYGDRAEELLTEDSCAGHGFLASVARRWEQEACAAQDLWGARVALLRFGAVLSPNGGALQRMLLPFKLGLGGKLASGKQWMSWISLLDATYAILFALASPQASGPINVVAPEPVTNARFTETLAQSLNRPAFATIPRFALRAVCGELADALLLSSSRVIPSRLEALGFNFATPRIEQALEILLGARELAPVYAE